MKKKNKAFTMLELLVVVAILAIIAILVIPNFLSSVQRSKDARELAEINSVQKAADTYYMDHGSYPTLQGNQPAFGDPKNLKFTTDENGEGLCPKYLTNLPHFSYWIVDYKGTVYHAYDKLGVKSGSSITLDSKYKYTLCNKSDSSIVQSNVTGTVPLTSSQYLKIVDDNGKELPALSLDFEEILLHPESEEYKEATAGSATVTYNKDGVKNCTGSITVNNSNAAMYDGNTSTCYSTYSMNVDIAVNGSMINRAVNILFTGGTYGHITVLDGSGQPLPFYTVETDTGRTLYGTDCGLVNKYPAGTIQIIVPKNAAKIHIAGSSSYSMQIYEIYANTDNIIPDSPSNVSCVQNEHSITLNWANPKDSDFKQVLIFREGKYAGQSVTGTFTDTGLSEDYNYNYTLIARDNNGNFSNSVSIAAHTIRVGIVLRGANYQVYDGNDATYVDMWGGRTEVTLEDADITNHVLGIYAAFQQPNTVTFTDSNGQALYFYACNPVNKVWSYTNSYIVYSGVMTVPVVVPKNAYKLTVAQGGGGNHTALYEIKEYSDNTLPGKVSSASYTATDTSITLKWSNPTDTDFSQVLIFRDGIYVGASKTGTITDNNLLENYNYNYTLVSQNTTGNMSDVITVSAKTAKVGIVFRGVDYRAYDNNSSTYYPLNTSSPIDLTWDDDITGKTITMTYWGGTYTYLKVLDASGNPLTFNANGTDTTQLDMGGRASCALVMPAGAAKITMRAASNAYNSGVYELKLN